MVERKDIEKMAKLARLEFSEEEKVKLAKSLGELMEYMKVLKGLDLAEVEPLLAVDSSPRPLREDEVKPSLEKDLVFGNAPAVNLDHFSIPKVIGG